MPDTPKKRPKLTAINSAMIRYGKVSHY